MSTVYLNGTFLAQDQAMVSVMDRGFLFADGIYEVFPVFQGKIFRCAEHLNRLQKSLNAIDFHLTITHSQWEQIFAELIQQNPTQAAEQTIYLQITRGAANSRTHAYPENLTPTIFANINDHQPPSTEQLNQGFKAITVPDIRWHRCNIKSTNLLPNILASKQADLHHAKDAIMIRDGYVIEAASSNVFIVKNGKIYTPPLSHYMLPGITRDLLIELAHTNEIACEEALVSEQALFDADEIWLSGSVKEITPIVKLNDQTVGNGKTGPITQKILAIYNNYKQKFIHDEHKQSAN